MNKKVLFLRGFFGAIALTCYFYTLQVLPLGTSVTLQQLSPLFAVIFATFLLKENASHLQYLLLIICLFGVYIIQGGGVFNFEASKQVSLLALILGILGAVFSALAYNLVRFLKSTENPMVIIFYFPLVTIPLAGTYSFINWAPLTWTDIPPLIGVGVFTQLGQLYMTKAYHLREIHELAIFRYLALPIAILMGWGIFYETPKPNDLIGIGIILSALIGSTQIKRLKKQKEKSI